MMNDNKTEQHAANTSMPHSVAVFGSSGGIGAAMVERFAAKGARRIYAGSRAGDSPRTDLIVPFAFDLEDEATIAEAANDMRSDPPEWVIVASGVLTLAGGIGPERSLKRLDPVIMGKVFAINTVGPAMVAKHMLPLMPRGRAFTFAALSARVGSISDNRLGGWHSYRASKAALNMLIRNFALEMGRTHPAGVVVGLHPGTVDTPLSQPFQSGLPQGQLTQAGEAAANLIEVLAGLSPDSSGQVFDFAGNPVAP